MPRGTAAALSKLGLRLFLLLMLTIAMCSSWAADASIQIAVYPEAVVADGSSSVTVTATIRDKNGSTVPDGTQVLFESTLGSFRNPSVTTINGIAQSQLTSGTLPGTAIITISVLQFRATARFDLPFVRSAAELSKAQVVYDLSSIRRLTYSPSVRIFRADGPDQGVRIRFGDSELKASDLELNGSTLECKATDGTLTTKNGAIRFRSIQFALNTLSGRALVNTQKLRVIYRPGGRYFSGEVFYEPRPKWVNLQSGVADLESSATATPLEFTDIYGDPTLIYARRATIVPGREVQMTDATLDVNGAKVMRVPRFRLGFSQRTEVVTDEFFQVANNQLAINFPYYLSLSAGNDSLLRFRYGTLFSRGVGGAGGLYFDFEKNWNTAGEDRGGLNLRGIGRRDWSLGARQSLRPNQNLRTFFSGDLVSSRTLFLNTFAENRFSGWRLTANGSRTANIRGSAYRSTDLSLSATTNPINLKNPKLSMSFGLGASDRSFTTSSSNSGQTSYGLDLFGNFAPAKILGGDLVHSFRVSQLWGRNVRNGLTSNYSMGLTKPLGAASSTSLIYDFTDDPFSATTLGKHRLSNLLTFSSNRFFASVFAAKSLDIDRLNMQADASFRFSPLWRVGGAFTLDRYAGSSYSDSSILIAHTLGYREVGLSWSFRKQRLGIELLGTPIR